MNKEKPILSERVSALIFIILAFSLIIAIVMSTDPMHR